MLKTLEGGHPMKTAKIFVISVLLALALVVAVRGAGSPGAQPPSEKPLSVTYYFLPG
jgi:hypothetical protein